MINKHVWCYDNIPEAFSFRQKGSMRTIFVVNAPEFPQRQDTSRLSYYVNDQSWKKHLGGLYRYISVSCLISFKTTIRIPKLNCFIILVKVLVLIVVVSMKQTLLIIELLIRAAPLCIENVRTLLENCLQ